MGSGEEPYIAFPMVCFCDIPLSRIEEHVQFYGEFGLGLTKEWAETNNLNPVMYLAPSNNVAKSFNEINDHANKFYNSEEETEKNNDDVKLAKTTLRYLIAHPKPLEGNMVIDGKPVVKEFYQESEWRYVPKNDKIKTLLKKPDFENSQIFILENEKTKSNCLLKFTPKDIKYIFVKSDSDIPSIINFIQTKLDMYPGADLKVLMSRVTSLESISHDV